MRRASVFAVLASAALAQAHPAVAQSYPARTIRLVVHSSPGGSSDILGRLIAQRLT